MTVLKCLNSSLNFCYLGQERKGIATLLSWAYLGYELREYHETDFARIVGGRVGRVRAREERASKCLAKKERE